MAHRDKGYHERKPHSGGTSQRHRSLQWSLLWFSTPTNLNLKFVNNGTLVAKFLDTVSSAIELTCNIAFDGAHTPRSSSVRLSSGASFTLVMTFFSRCRSCLCASFFSRSRPSSLCSILDLIFVLHLLLCGTDLPVSIPVRDLVMSILHTDGSGTAKVG